MNYGTGRSAAARRSVERAAELAEIVDADRPAWAAALGDRPAEPAPARDWDRAAALAAAYREQFAVTDESTVLGAEQPANGTQGRAWAAANNALQAAHQVAEAGQTDQRSLANRSREREDFPPTPRPHANWATRNSANGSRPPTGLYPSPARSSTR